MLARFLSRIRDQPLSGSQPAVGALAPISFCRPIPWNRTGKHRAARRLPVSSPDSGTPVLPETGTQSSSIGRIPAGVKWGLRRFCGVGVDNPRACGNAPARAPRPPAFRASGAAPAPGRRRRGGRPVQGPAPAQCGRRHPLRPAASAISVFPVPHSAITAAAWESFQRFTTPMMASVCAGKGFRSRCPNRDEGISSMEWSGG
jgi:hypothetical protein